MPPPSPRAASRAQAAEAERSRDLAALQVAQEQERTAREEEAGRQARAAAQLMSELTEARAQVQHAQACRADLAEAEKTFEARLSTTLQDAQRQWYGPSPGVRVRMPSP